MVLNTCTYQLSRVKQSLCLSWTGMDEKIQSAVTPGFLCALVEITDQYCSLPNFT